MLDIFLDMHPQALYELVGNLVAFYIAAVFFFLGSLAGYIITCIRLEKKLPISMREKNKEQKLIIKSRENDIINLAADNAAMRGELDRVALIGQRWIEGNKEDRDE